MGDEGSSPILHVKHFKCRALEYTTYLAGSVTQFVIHFCYRNNSCDAFAAMLSNPKKLMEGRFEILELCGCPVQVIPYTTVAEVSEIEDALENFYSIYDPNASTKSPLQKMTAVSNFISSADHFHITKYTLEYCLCGNKC